MAGAGEDRLIPDLLVVHPTSLRTGPPVAWLIDSACRTRSWRPRCKPEAICDGDFSQIHDLPDGIAIDACRWACQVPSIYRSLLTLEPYRTLGVGLTKSLPMGRDLRLELLVEWFTITNHVNFSPPFGNPPGAGRPDGSPGHSLSGGRPRTRRRISPAGAAARSTAEPPGTWGTR